MDPITLFLLYNLGLGAWAVASEVNAGPKYPPILVRTAWRPVDGSWEATQLMSPAALEIVGSTEMFDLDLESWAPMLQTDFYRAVVLVRPGYGVEDGAVVRLCKEGATWQVDVAFGPHSTTPKAEVEKALHQMLMDLNSADHDAMMGNILVYTLPDGGRIVRLGTDAALAQQGALMGYDLLGWMQALQQTRPGTYFGYSLTDSNQVPLASFVVEKTGEGAFCVIEQAAQQNSEPSSADASRISTFVAALQAATPAQQGAACGPVTVAQIEGRSWTMPETSVPMGAPVAVAAATS